MGTAQPGGPDARRRILDASVAMAAAEGVRALSFRAVARRAGVSHQAPYHLFGDHRGILREIAREGFEGLAAAMRDAAAARDDPVDALAAAGLAYVDYACRHVGHFRVMFQHRVLGGGDPLHEAQATRALVSELAGAALAAVGRHDLSREAVAELSWSAVHGFAVVAAEGLTSTTAADQAAQRAGAVAAVEAFTLLLRGAPSQWDECTPPATHV